MEGEGSEYCRRSRATPLWIPAPRLREGRPRGNDGGGHAGIACERTGFKPAPTASPCAARGGRNDRSFARVSRAGETLPHACPSHPHPRIKSGAGSSPLPSRERGYRGLPAPLDSRLRGNDGRRCMNLPQEGIWVCERRDRLEDWRLLDVWHFEHHGVEGELGVGVGHQGVASVLDG